MENENKTIYKTSRNGYFGMLAKDLFDEYQRSKASLKFKQKLIFFVDSIESTYGMIESQNYEEITYFEITWLSILSSVFFHGIQIDDEIFKKVKYYKVYHC